MSIVDKVARTDTLPTLDGDENDLGKLWRNYGIMFLLFESSVSDSLCLSRLVRRHYRDLRCKRPIAFIVTAPMHGEVTLGGFFFKGDELLQAKRNKKRGRKQNTIQRLYW